MLLSAISSLGIILLWKRKSWLFYFNSVMSVSVPNGAAGQSGVCHCGISRSYSLAFLKKGKLTIVMLFPLSNIWSNLVTLLPSGVLSLEYR